MTWSEKFWLIFVTVMSCAAGYSSFRAWESFAVRHVEPFLWWSGAAVLLAVLAVTAVFRSCEGVD